MHTHSATSLAFVVEFAVPGTPEWCEAAQERVKEFLDDWAGDRLALETVPAASISDTPEAYELILRWAVVEARDGIDALRTAGKVLNILFPALLAGAVAVRSVAYENWLDPDRPGSWE